MAVASRQTPATVQQLTPPSSSHGGRGSWAFAVPIDSTKNHLDEPFMSEDITPAHPYSPRQPLAAQANGASKPLRSNTLDSQGQNYEEEQGYLAPNQRVNELNKKGSGDVSANSSDSALEYYRASEGKNGAAKNKGRKKTGKPTRANWTEVEKDENNWIHRDKLKEIESRELEEAGFKVGRASRSNSRSQSARRASRDRTNSEATNATQNSDERVETRRVVSPIPAEGEEEEVEHTSWDLRTPQEIAAEREQYAARNTHIIRPSTSRIPVAKTSPAPASGSFADRDQSLPRSRKGSANWSGDAISTNGARVRSGSTSSGVLLDEPQTLQDSQKSPMQGNFSTPTSPVSGSPPKAKVPGKATPASGARKTSAQKSQTKPRTTSASSPVKRPGTSGGSISRPTTSHRPEGEAPWIATMYKPDPRLPPDQQIIPTHAKRLQQDQWETEGRVASMYDKDFRMLNTDEFQDKRASQIQPIDIETAQEDQQWPLPSPEKPTLERVDTNAKSPTNEQGAYKLTPTIPQSPRIQSRASGRHPAPTTSPKPENTVRVPEPAADDEKEKKNCCCIVM